MNDLDHAAGGLTDADLLDRLEAIDEVLYGANGVEDIIERWAMLSYCLRAKYACLREIRRRAWRN